MSAYGQKTPQTINMQIKIHNKTFHLVKKGKTDQKKNIFSLPWYLPDEELILFT